MNISRRFRLQGFRIIVEGIIGLGLAQLCVSCVPLPFRITEPQLYKTNIRENLGNNSVAVQSKEPENTDWLANDLVQRRPDNIRFSKEKEWYRTSGELPERCIAFSGGGIRSASFSVGVMTGLRSWLDTVDIMSGVSGGAYALSWYYMQHYNAAANKDTGLTNGERERAIRVLFDPLNVKASREGKGFDLDRQKAQQKSRVRGGQAYLRDHSRFATELHYTAAFLGNLPLIPFHLIANGLFAWRLNIGLPSMLYENRIASTFYQSPDGATLTVPTIYELGRFAKASRLPLFIFNTTAWPGITDSAKLTLHDSVFSFSPVQYGSGGFGLYRYPDDKDAEGKYVDLRPLKLNEVVAISGAAFDFNTLTDSKWKQMIASIFALDLGGYIANPSVGKTERWVQNSLPIPIYFSYRFTPDVTGTGIYLSDGGHAENLGVYPLVIRGCKTIVIIDAEHDPHYQFGSYFLLRRNLREELHVDLSVPDIEEGLDLGEIERNLHNQESRLFAYDETEEKNPEIGPRWNKFASKPIMKGKITGFPGLDAITITYVKLAYKPVERRDPNWTYYIGGKVFPIIFGNECSIKTDIVSDYYYCILDERKEKWLYPIGISEPFPQQPTPDQNFSSEQFTAYVVLGTQKGEELARVLNGEIAR